MQPQEENYNVPNFMKSDFGDNKLDKSNELNASMSISPSAPDELETTIWGVF